MMAPVVDVHAPGGDTTARLELDESVFGLTPNMAVLHQVVTAQRAAARRGTQSTKTRAEVRGGGAKPFRQKGTGRARAGSERSPQFVGGGVALGPKPRSYRQRTPKKMVRLALLSALSDRAAESRVAVVERWAFEEPSTQSAVRELSRLGVGGRILVVLDRDDEVAARSFRNIPEVQTIVVDELNAYDILINDWLVFSRATLPGEVNELAAPPVTHAREPETETVDEAETASAPAASAGEEASVDETAADEAAEDEDVTAEDEDEIAADEGDEEAQDQ
jgi:large subunit ribosomal protein L4